MSSRRPRTRNRRIFEPDGANLRGRQRHLGRVMLVLGALIAFAILGGSLVGLEGEPAVVEVPGGIRHEAPESMPLVRVDRVIDGDTLDVRAAGTALRVRVFGIDAPERGEPCFAEASEHLERYAGDEVRLMPDERLSDRFGRELRYLFTPDGASIDAAMVHQGLAVAWTDDGAMRDELVALEAEARGAGRGCLWE